MTRPLRVLYVDDEADIRTIVKFALENDDGFQVEVCASGKEAVDKVERYAPDLILLDVMMPGMDGPTTFKRLRELDGCRKTPVVFVTAKAQSRDVQQFLAMGAIDVIAKPFHAMKLADQVRTIWGRGQNG